MGGRGLEEGKGPGGRAGVEATQTISLKVGRSSTKVASPPPPSHTCTPLVFLAPRRLFLRFRCVMKVQKTLEKEIPVCVDHVM